MVSKSGFQAGLTLNIGENKYEIAPLTAGVLIDIEARKVSFSNGQYSNLVRSGLVSSRIGYEIVEAFAVLTVLVPSLSKDLKVETVFELDPASTIELIKVYKESIIPWYENVTNLFKEAFDQDEKKRSKHTASSGK
jgi:hypothetical protein